MGFRPSKEIKLLMHPYVFVLKEGGQITNDYLDYSLLMLQVTCPEKLKSPLKKSIKKPFTPISEVETSRSAFNIF